MFTGYKTEIDCTSTDHISILASRKFMRLQIDFDKSEMSQLKMKSALQYIIIISYVLMQFV